MSSMFFDNATGLLRVLLVGTSAYVALLLLLKISGKRTLAKLSAFDFVVTIALGSILSSTVLSKDVALVEGVTAMGLLVGLQFVVAWLITRSDTAARWVKSEPTLLYYDGFRRPAMRRCRVSANEMLQVARGSGHADLRDVAAMVLESDGTISVVTGLPDELTFD